VLADKPSDKAPYSGLVVEVERILVLVVLVFPASEAGKIDGTIRMNQKLQLTVIVLQGNGQSSTGNGSDTRHRRCLMIGHGQQLACRMRRASLDRTALMAIPVCGQTSKLRYLF